MLCLFNISHFSSTACTAAMAKRAQQGSGEERVTAKSRPMMNLVARASSHVSSSTSVSPVKRYYGNQDPWKSVAEKQERSGRPDVDSQREARPQQFVIGNDEAELELSVESRSFVNGVNDQVRKRQKRISNVTEDGEKHSMIWRMFMTVTMESAVFMEKNYLNNCQSITNTTDPTLKQMFDISTRLVSEQDEISGLETVGWENYSWKYLSLIGDERIINLLRTKVYVFSDSVLCLGKILKNTQSNDAWEQRLGWLKSSSKYRNFDRIDGEPMELEWNISQDSIRCSSVKKSNVYC